MTPTRAARPHIQRAWLVAALLALGAGCSSTSNETVEVVSVSSDLTIGSEIDTVNIVVADGELSYPFTLGAGAGKSQLPVRVALVPGGKTDRQFRVQAIGMLGSQQVVTQSATVSFVSGTAQQLSLFLARSCVNVPMCNDGFTCQNGACVPESTAGTRGMYTGDAGASTADSGQDRHGDAGSGGGIGAGGAIGIGGTNGGGGSSGTGGSSGIAGANGSGGTFGTGGGPGTGGLSGLGGSGTGGMIGIGGAGAGSGIGGTGIGGTLGTGGVGAGSGSGGTGIGGTLGTGGAGAGSGMGGFTSTGLGGAGGTFGLGGGGGKLPGPDGGAMLPGLGGSAAFPSGLILFQDDFESGSANAWSPTDPTAWQVVDGSGIDATSVYQHDGAFTTGNVSIAGDPSWDDVAVEARVNVSAFAGSSASELGGICARVSVPGDYYLLALRADGHVDLRRVSSYAETILTTTSAPVIAANTWYTVRLSAVGPNLSAYLNGALILTAADATFPAGQIGLQTDSASAQFDDVVVTTP